MTLRSMLVFGILAFSLLVSHLFFAGIPVGYTQAVSTSALATVAASSDFTAAVQAGLQALATNPAAQADRQQIQNQDYKSTWDEFGTNVLVDGATPPPEINNQVMSDIAQSAEAAQSYDQQEADYLRAQQVTPEQVQSTEQSVGIDVPPSEQVDANPSIGANPDVNLSPADVTTPESAPSSETEIITEPISPEGNATTRTNTFGTSSTSISVSVPLSAGIEVMKSVDNPSPPIGGTINYTLLVSALGPDTSTAVTVADALPIGVTFADATSSVGTYDGSTGIWDIGDMSPNSTATLVIMATVDSSDTIDQSIANTTTVGEAANETNPDQDNASSTVVITVTANDTMIFNAILQGEQTQSSSTQATTTAISSDTAPSTTVPSP